MKHGKIVRGNIRYTASDDYTEVESIDGGLDVVGADTKTAFPNLTTIGGWLNVRGAHAKTAFPNLTTISGGLNVRDADTKTALPKLTAIGGWLNVSGADTKIAFPKLTTIGGGLDVRGADIKDAFPNLETMGGSLYVYGADTRTAFPKLTTIGGGMYAHDADTRTAFPKLTTIGEGLYVSGADTKAAFPNLTTIGGGMYAHDADTRTAFPKLKQKNSDKAKQIVRRNLNRSLLKSGYMFQDGILSKHIASRKLSNGLIVHTVIIVGKTDKSYVIETPDGVYAHGDTVKQARDSLLYKLSENRDTTPYKAWTLDTSITKRQAIQSYMAITGACETGTRHFVETRFGGKVPARTTVRKVIEMTAGQYKSDVYKEFFEKRK